MIDTHCHFDVEEFDHDRIAVAARSLAAGVEAIVIPGYLASLWPTLFAVCESLPQPRLFAAPGLHPCYITQHEAAHLAELERLLQTRPDIVAVGEIGLDYYVTELKDPALKARQADFFVAQLRLAARYQKPVILHVRKAHQEVLAILKAEKFALGGIVHAYSGGIEEARHYARLGFCLGIGGPVTYDQARRLRSVVEQMPLEALVLETDAPDMIPAPHRQPDLRHTRNSPEFLPAVAAGMSAVKNLPLDVVLHTTRETSIRVLGLPLRD
jgi:TatD DNase family protein